MYRFHKWGITHRHPYGKDIPSQKSSELFDLITDENGLFSNYTIQSLLDELDTIEYYQLPGKAHHLSEVTAK